MEEKPTHIKSVPSLLVLMGSLDWLTTIVGILYFGAVEGNPFLSALTETNLLAFTAVKLGTVFFVGFLFYQAENLTRTENQNTPAAKCTRLILRSAYVASLAFLVFAVVNNIWTVMATR